MHRILVLGSFLLASLSFGQEQTPYPMKKSALLWEISGNGLKEASFLFGTAHLIEKDYFIFPKKLEKVFSKADVLVMELAGISDQSEVMELLMLEKGTSFFDFFQPTQLDSIYVWAEDKMGMDSMQFKMGFARFKPFVVSQIATQMAMGDDTESYERTFEQMALTEEKEIIGLETAAFQMRLFDGLTDEQQAEMLMKSIRDPEEQIAQTKQMMEIYSGQNVDSLYLFIENEGDTFSDEQAVFLDQRNANWIPLIEDIIKTQRAFIAVGAGHLGGPKGVIRLLESRGYQLKPIKL